MHVGGGDRWRLAGPGHDMAKKPRKGRKWPKAGFSFTKTFSILQMLFHFSNLFEYKTNLNFKRFYLQKIN
jgi:hypothetical protein